ncbi:hypothetical protein SCUP234_04859 [Seiridium cupressi]
MPTYGAARIAIARPFHKKDEHSWSRNDKESKNSADVLAGNIELQVEAMNMCQYTRDQAVDSNMMSQAIWYEHHQLVDTKIVACPEADKGRAMAPRKGYARLAQDLFKSQITPTLLARRDVPRMILSEFFLEMRERPYTIWPVRTAGNHWIVISMHIEETEEDDVTEKDGNGHLDKYEDRVIRRVAIIDSRPRTAKSRRELAKATLATVLDNGCIGVADNAVIQPIQVPQVDSSWQTGYVSYAIIRELMRRLRVLVSVGFGANPEFLWGDFEEDLNVNGWREAMGLACAMRAIQVGDYQPRLAIEIPGDKGLQREDLNVASGSYAWPGHQYDDPTEEHWLEGHIELDLTAADSDEICHSGSELDSEIENHHDDAFAGDRSSNYSDESESS